MSKQKSIIQTEKVVRKTYSKKEYSSRYGYLKECTVHQSVDNSSLVTDIMGNPFHDLKGPSLFRESSILSGHRANEYKYFITSQRKFYGILVVGIFAGIAFTLLWRKNSETFRHESWEEKFRKLPIDVKLVSFLLSILLVVTTTRSLVGFVIYSDV